MGETRASLEIIAPSVEEAVAKGLSDLGMSEDAVVVEVLDPGTHGIFGLGSRQARVRLTIKASSDQETAEVVKTGAAEPAPKVELPKAAVDYTPSAPPPAKEAATTNSLGKPAPVEAVLDDENALQVARETVNLLLEKMKVRAKVTASFGQAEDAQSRIPVLVDVRGEDLSILIGPRAETLNALQYISSLIVSKELGHAVPLVVDVQGYRQRRAQQIRQLARRMADQAIKTGRRQYLEPMPANERRLVHIELRDHPDVTTESIGEEPRRKVTIIPKE